MADELDVQTNFRSMRDWEEGKEALDAIFHRIFDILKSNPTLHALVDGRESDPVHKAGDFVTDYTTGDVKLKVSDGKNLIQISLSSLGGSISADQHGALGFETSDGSQLHTNASTTDPGFMSAADKVAVNGISSPPNPSNATPGSATASAGAAGASALYARGDHTHQVSTAAPVSVGTANSAGSAATLARSDHVHNHGNQAGGALHAVATGATAGFMAAADKSLLDQFDGYTAGGGAPTPALGHYAFWHDGGVSTYLYFTGASGTKRVLLT